MSARELEQSLSTRLILLVTIIVVHLVFGCQTLPRQRVKTGEREKTKLTAYELRIAVGELARTFSHVIEAAADEVIARSSDADIRRQALLWKM